MYAYYTLFGLIKNKKRKQAPLYALASFPGFTIIMGYEYLLLTVLSAVDVICMIELCAHIQKLYTNANSASDHRVHLAMKPACWCLCPIGKYTHSYTKFTLLSTEALYFTLLFTEQCRYSSPSFSFLARQVKDLWDDWDPRLTSLLLTVFFYYSNQLSPELHNTRVKYDEYTSFTIII